jgi:hypothetical protein
MNTHAAAKEAPLIELLNSLRVARNVKKKQRAVAKVVKKKLPSFGLEHSNVKKLRS